MPNRIIKESICYSDDLDKLTPFEETVFYRLMVNVDDYGRLDARLGFLKSKLFVTKQGITEKNISDAIQKLASLGLIRIYIVQEKSYLMFPKWEVHQQIRAKKSKYPAPEDNGYQMISNDIKCHRNPIQSESNPNSNTIQKEKATNKFVPPSFEEVKSYCLERDNKIDAQQFVDFYSAKGWLVGKTKMKDWKACVRTWETRNKEYPQHSYKPKGKQEIIPEFMQHGYKAPESKSVENIDDELEKLLRGEK